MKSFLIQKSPGILSLYDMKFNSAMLEFTKSGYFYLFGKALMFSYMAWNFMSAKISPLLGNSLLKLSTKHSQLFLSFLFLLWLLSVR